MSVIITDQDEREIHARSIANANVDHHTDKALILPYAMDLIERVGVMLDAKVQHRLVITIGTRSAVISATGFTASVLRLVGEVYKLQNGAKLNVDIQDGDVTTVILSDLIERKDKVAVHFKRTDGLNELLVYYGDQEPSEIVMVEATQSVVVKMDSIALNTWQAITPQEFAQKEALILAGRERLLSDILDEPLNNV